MIRGIGKYLSDGFYEGRAALFDSALDSYAEDRDPDSESIISTLMVESGFREEENCYIDLEKEFFCSGVLDKEKSDAFKKELILYYSLDFLKYSFFGTQSHMTRITGDALKREGKNLLDYLPSAERRKREKSRRASEKQKHDRYRKENKVPIYLYGDGSMSTYVNSEKSRTEFNRLGNSGGSFDFSGGYDPNREVADKSWMAGFNKSNTWEMVATSSPEKGDSSSVDNQSDDVSPQVELLFDSDVLYLLDIENLLQSGIEEEYYSVSGELYARREIDREKSIEAIKNAVKGSGTNTISTVVLKDNSLEAQEYYKEHFKDFITGKTIFAALGDEKTEEKLTSIREKQAEEQLSRSVLSRFYELMDENRSGDELVGILDHSLKGEDYDLELDLFASPQDMALFVKSNRETVDEEVLDYIQTTAVPSEKARDYSRSVQNLIKDQQQLTSMTGKSLKELLALSYDKTVNNKDIEADKITKTTSLSEIFAETGNSTVNLNNSDARSSWLKDNLEKPYSGEMVSLAENLIPEKLSDKQSAALVSAFEYMIPIAASTGMTPLEVISSALTGEGKDKRIFIENDLNELIDASALQKAPPVTVGRHKTLKTSNINLTDPSKIELFTLSPLVKNFESDEKRVKLAEYLKSSPVSIKDSKEFSTGLINALNNRDRFPAGTDSLFIARTIADSLNGTDLKMDILVEKSLKVYSDKSSAPLQYNLLDRGDLKLFSNDPVLDILDDDEKVGLIDYLAAKPVSNKNSGEFSQVLLMSLKEAASFPQYARAVDVAESISRKINGLTLPEEHKTFIQGLFDNKATVQKLSAPLKYNLIEKTGLDMFSSDPLFTSLGGDEQSELISYLKNNPVEQKYSRDFTGSFLRGLKSRKAQNPADLAKTLAALVSGNKADVPGDMIPLIKSSLAIPLDKKKTVPLNYNFSDKAEINRFAYDPVMSSFSSDEQDELIDYLKSAPVSVKNSPAFSRSLTGGLRSLPKMTKPISFASSLATRINSVSAPVRNSGKNYNLLNSSGQSSFYKTKSFRNSGVSKAGFSSLVDSQRSSLSSYSPDSSILFPLSFRKMDIPAASSEEVSASGTSNNIYNQGYVVKKGQGRKPSQKSIGRQKKEVYGNFGQSQSAPKQNSRTPVTTMAVASVKSSPMGNIPGMGNPLGTGGNIVKMPSAGGRLRSTPSGPPPQPPMSAEEQRMAQIQKNYLNDKQALAQDGLSLPSGQQMLAKSKGSGSASSGTGKGGAVNRKVIEESTELLSDSLINEFLMRSK